MSSNETRHGRFPFSPRQIAGLLLLLLAAVFIVENRRSTTVRFLIPEVTAPLWLALFVAMMLGVVAGALLARNRPAA